MTPEESAKQASPHSLPWYISTVSCPLEAYKHTFVLSFLYKLIVSLLRCCIHPSPSSPSLLIFEFLPRTYEMYISINFLLSTFKMYNKCFCFSPGFGFFLSKEVILSQSKDLSGLSFWGWSHSSLMTIIYWQAVLFWSKQTSYQGSYHPLVWMRKLKASKAIKLLTRSAEFEFRFIWLKTL